MGGKPPLNKGGFNMSMEMELSQWKSTSLMWEERYYAEVDKKNKNCWHNLTEFVHDVPSDGRKVVCKVEGSNQPVLLCYNGNEDEWYEEDCVEKVDRPIAWCDWFEEE